MPPKTRGGGEGEAIFPQWRFGLVRAIFSHLEEYGSMRSHFLYHARLRELLPERRLNPRGNPPIESGQDTPAQRCKLLKIMRGGVGWVEAQRDPPYELPETAFGQLLRTRSLPVDGTQSLAG